ncbi:MAG: response regulator [Opitutae bacterium]|nr:response regulator [Opitutae bacterium]
MKILVVEDNLQSRYMLEQFLTARGHAVWSAAEGRAALALCRERGQPDVVVSDALMPTMDGFELCYALRQDTKWCNVPFILYTATYTAESDERFAMSVGVDRFVVKPIEPDELLGIIEAVVEQVRTAPPRAPQQLDPRPAFLEEYARVVSVKLEDKLAELARANATLTTSAQTMRELNERLAATVQRLEGEIAERRRAEQLLHLAHQVGGLGSWETVPGVGDVVWSASALKLFGLTESAPTLADVLAGVEEPSRVAVSNYLGTAPAGGERPATLEFGYAEPKTGRRRRFQLRGQEVAVVPQGPLVRLGTVQDITERHETETRRQTLEQQLFRAQKMEALGALAGGIAHDFNNILTTIFGHAEILREEMAGANAAPAWRDSIAEILNAAVRSRDTVQQILTFSRRQSVERRAQPLARVVEEGLRLVRATLNRRVLLQVQLDSDRHVMANETQIHQVLLNLCTNAAHAMSTTGGTLSVAVDSVDLPASADSRSGPHVRLRVIDTGTGMEPQVLERIFEPFFTTKPAGEGTGLGLAVVHGIVQAHDATIQAESKVGQGTTFTVLFPAVAATPLPASEILPTGLPLGRGRHVLVVDDEPSVARLCVRFLERLGYRTTMLTEPGEARAVFLRDPRSFDAAVVDYLMPRLNGVDLIRTMRSVRPGFPAVLVAGFGGQLDAAKARSEGVREFVAKPFSIVALAEALDRVLD